MQHGDGYSVRDCYFRIRGCYLQCWCTDLNLPLAGISLVLVALFLRVRTPEGSMKDKLARVDWM